MEKSAQLTVQHGKMRLGKAAGGTSHCQCALAGCNSRAEPWTKSRIASHAGADNPKPSATPKSIGATDKMLRVPVNDPPAARRDGFAVANLIASHATKTSSIKTV